MVSFQYVNIILQNGDFCSVSPFVLKYLPHPVLFLHCIERTVGLAVFRGRYSESFVCHLTCINPRPVGLWRVTHSVCGGGGGRIAPPPVISQTAWPICKVQTPFDSPVHTWPFQIMVWNLTSRSLLTSQVRSNSECLTFRAWWHRRAQFRC